MTNDERVDAILDANKFQLFDENTDLRAEMKVTRESVTFLRAEVAALRDLAYRGAGGDGQRDALEAIFTRASRALDTEANR